MTWPDTMPSTPSSNLQVCETRHHSTCHTVVTAGCHSCEERLRMLKGGCSVHCSMEVRVHQPPVRSRIVLREAQFNPVVDHQRDRSATVEPTTSPADKPRPAVASTGLPLAVCRHHTHEGCTPAKLYRFCR